MSLERLSCCLTATRFSASYLIKISPSRLRLLHFSRFQIMFLLHSGAPPYTTSTHRRCCQNGRFLPCRQSPRLDYANSVLFGTSTKNLAHLHRMQSTLARVVTMQRGRISISKTLSDLHWLPMKFRVDFKVATLTVKVLESGELGYLYSRIGIATSRRTPRSSVDTRKLSVIPSRTKIDARAFRHSAPQVWNSLPLDIRSASSVQSFKSRLKTHYFRQSFN